MSVLQEAEIAIDEFVKNNVSCNTCIFFEKELFGGICNGYELPLGRMENSDSMCEQHQFANDSQQSQLESLQKIWVNAWQIVHGFLYRY